MQTPLLNLQVRRVERSVNRLAGGVVFAGLLVAGAILYSANPGLARILMGAAAVPLVWMVFARGRHPQR